LTPFAAVERFINVAGKKVLEIGGNSECVAAIPFVNAGAAEIIVSGLDHIIGDHQPKHQKIRIEYADALKLSEIYAAGSFDIVYGVSILEHIPNPPKFFSEVSYVLAPGGVAFLQGSPLWSGPWGHHIWLVPWLDNVTGCYQFMPSEELIAQGVAVINPIPDWGHLLLTPEQLTTKLEEQGIPEQDISIIVEHVYEGGYVNREFPSNIYNEMKNSGMTVTELEFDRVEIDRELIEQLKLKYSDREDFSIMGMRAILRKT
jgi:SAM-dependent methyltransferase